ncbi:hypothetical protein GE061_009704 [Apolygus lucorum]|uniref:Uncharacterized protein n=1 Tax=Apolygus lucorum TaxID=248454 RepID=A0A6A4K6W9_APOLU|nr:hypothetical protein GE061_009704 [Apolygus lucorum]
MTFSCMDSNSMRFIPLYHDFKACEKRLRATYSVREDIEEANLPGSREIPSYSLRFQPLYARISEVQDLPPARMSASVSIEGFATSSPAPRSSRFFRTNTLVTQDSSDSGILTDSSSLLCSSPGIIEKPSPVVNSGLKKNVTILRRSQSGLDALNYSVSCDGEMRDLSSEFEKLEISKVEEKSRNDSLERVERRPKGRGRSRTFRSKAFTTSSTSTYLLSNNSGTAATSRTSTTSRNRKAALPRSSLCDDNNNKSAKESSSTSNIVPKIRQLLDANIPQPWCTFCKSNNETDDFMRSHTLKQWDPRTGVYKMTCPVLRSYVCPNCGATGDKAHTYTYCPRLIHEMGFRPKSLITKIKCTRHNSSGKERPSNSTQLQ